MGPSLPPAEFGFVWQNLGCQTPSLYTFQIDDGLSSTPTLGAMNSRHIGCYDNLHYIRYI